MLNRFFYTALLLCASLITVYGQEEEAEEKVTYEEPFEVPGNVIIDLGFNFLRNDGGVETGFWGSKSVGIYYLYEKTWENSHFSINPGIGVGLEKYDFRDDYTIVETTNDEGIEVTDIVFFDEEFLAENGIVEIRKSKLAAEYVEVPLEFRYYKNKRNHDVGLRVALGVKGGFLFTSRTKLKFEAEDGDNDILKEKNDFHLNRFRASAYGRIGFGGFNLFYEQGLTDLFQNDQGPNGTDASYFKFGISFIGF